mmetsp:Transcript_25106/g.82297  ORF Transcript_25106/g.82297 Transcript_25106/m.82297 type:complete len:267 (+) Transcript_25106:269-1069(+)
MDAAAPGGILGQLASRGGAGEGRRRPQRVHEERGPDRGCGGYGAWARAAGRLPRRAAAAAGATAAGTAARRRNFQRHRPGRRAVAVCASDGRRGRIRATRADLLLRGGPCGCPSAAAAAGDAHGPACVDVHRECECDAPRSVWFRPRAADGRRRGTSGGHRVVGVKRGSGGVEVSWGPQRARGLQKASAAEATAARGRVSAPRRLLGGEPARQLLPRGVPRGLCMRKDPRRLPVSTLRALPRGWWDAGSDDRLLVLRQRDVAGDGR